MNRQRFPDKIIVTMFGLPGSGKSSISDAWAAGSNRVAAIHVDDYLPEIADFPSPAAWLQWELPQIPEPVVVFDFAYLYEHPEIIKQSDLVVLVDGDINEQIKRSFLREKSQEFYKNMSFEQYKDIHTTMRRTHLPQMLSAINSAPNSLRVFFEFSDESLNGIISELNRRIVSIRISRNLFI